MALLEKLDYCPCCGGKNLSQYIDCKDFTVSSAIFSIVLCGDCKLKFTSPRVAEGDIAGYYESEDYISHSGTRKGLINRLYLLVRNYTLKQKVGLIASFNLSGNNVLDYGAGTGDFLNALKRAEYIVSGVEPSAQARTLAKSKHGLELFDGINHASFTIHHFDVITLWHVLEHIHQLNETLQKFKSLLKDDGVLLVAVPNADSYDARVYKEFWAAYDVPRHLYHFNIESMKELMKRNGFVIEKVLPMYFDSFYVSMLSEKYKNGNIVRAFLLGLLSDMQGLFYKRNFSSLIYVLKKIV